MSERNIMNPTGRVMGGGNTGIDSPSLSQRSENAFSTGRLNEDFAGSENSFNSSLRGNLDFDGSDIGDVQEDHPCLRKCPSSIGEPLIKSYDFVQDEVFINKCGCRKETCLKHTLCWAFVCFVAVFLVWFALEDFAGKYSSIDRTWREKLNISSSVDVLHEDGRWCPAVITDSSDKTITIQPQDETEDFTYTLDRDSQRIQMPGKKTSDQKFKEQLEEQQSATKKLQDNLKENDVDIAKIKETIKEYSTTQARLQEDRYNEMTNFRTTMETQMDDIDVNLRKIQKKVSSLENRVEDLSREQINTTKIKDMVDERVTELCSPKINELKKDLDSVLAGCGSGTVTWEKVEDKIDESVNFYMYADATGEIDFISDVYQCSSTFTHFNVFDKWVAHAMGAFKPCDKVLEPVRRSGDCWPMEGSNGYITFELMMPIKVSHIRMDHIDQRVSTKPDTTPKHFKISVSKTGGTYEDLPLVSSKFMRDGKASQIFRTDEKASERLGFVKFVKFEILSNYGNEFYTCLYRLRVHGKPEEELPATDES